MSMSCLTTKGMRNNGTMCARVSIDHAKVVPVGKVCTAKETLEKNTAKVLDVLLVKTINNARQITAKVAGKVVSISEASIRTNLIFDDADGMDSLPNQAIFDTIQLMGYEGDLTDEGASSESLSVEQPSPSPAPTSEVPNESLPDSSSAQPSEVSVQAKEIKLLKAKFTKLKKQAKPVIKHHKEYLKIISLQQRFPKKSFSKKQRVHKKSVSKQGRKKAKGESEVHRDPLFDVMPEDKFDYIETENAQSEGRTGEKVDEDKEFDEDRLSTEDGVSTDKEGVSTDFEKVSTDRPIVSTDESKVSTDEQVEATGRVPMSV
ncbi:hypothetical protein Tco_0888658 [Tanacetum coccineum]